MKGPNTLQLDMPRCPGKMQLTSLFKGSAMRFTPVLFILLQVVSAGVAWGQTSDRRDPGIPFNYRPMDWMATHLPKQTMWFQRLPGISADYKLGTGDVVKVEILGNDELSQEYRIENSGRITAPLLGEISAEGLTAEELEAKIAAELKEKHLINNPEVLVYIDSYEAKPIYIVGEVDNPGEYVMSQQLTLMDALFLAGGLDYTASRYGFLHRRITDHDKGTALPEGEQIREKPLFNVLMDGLVSTGTILKYPEAATPDTEVIKIDLQPFKEGNIVEPNIKLRKGDVFVVPRRNVQFYYVIGDVLSPGAYEIPDKKEPLLASQAISWAKGPSKTAKMSQGMLVRYGQDGTRIEKKVDYAAILHGEQSDFTVLPNDIIFIPGSKAKTLGYGLLGIIPSSVERGVSSSTPTLGNK
jgi:polysaccharide export outer membrane protein